MSEKLLKFLLSELKIIRVRCQSQLCGAIIEVPAAKVAEMFKHLCCPICNANLLPERAVTGPNAFQQLAGAIDAFNKNANHIQIEFVIPEQDGAAVTV